MNNSVPIVRTVLWCHGLSQLVVKFSVCTSCAANGCLSEIDLFFSRAAKFTWLLRYFQGAKNLQYIASGLPGGLPLSAWSELAYYHKHLTEQEG